MRPPRTRERPDPAGGTVVLSFSDARRLRTPLRVEISRGHARFPVGILVAPTDDVALVSHETWRGPRALEAIMIRFSMWRQLAAAGISILGLATYACSAPGAATDSNASGDSESGLKIYFPTMYSAYDGQHDFKIPVMINGVTKVHWTASDPEMVDIDDSNDGTAVISVRKAGTVTIRAKAGSLKGEAELTITESKDNEWEAGNQRYNNGIVLQRGKRDGDGGGYGEGGGGGGGGGGGEQFHQASCTNCHGTGGGDESKDVEHTPMQTGGYSDAELVTIFTKGQKPAGVAQRVMMNKARWTKMHQWAMDEFAVKGLVVYLRSLEPKSQGPVDFGGHGKGGGDGKGKDKGSSGGPTGGDQPPPDAGDGT
jgi:hypothetical protein